MAGQINKGKIATISDAKARVVPSDREDKATAKLVVPWHLRGDTGDLEVGDEVIYAEFDDGTGILLGRMDGDWGEYLPKLRSDNITDDGVRLAAHKHSGVEPGSGNTGNPA